MAENSDIVVIGSGHNGLVAAAYLAKAGKKVTVLERQPWFGGGVVTRDLTLPGFHHDQHSMAHIFIQANPLIKNDELGLISKYGMKYTYPEMPTISVFPDGETIPLWRDRQKNYANSSASRKRTRNPICASPSWRGVSAAADGRNVHAAGAGRRHVRDDGSEPRRPRHVPDHAEKRLRHRRRMVRERSRAPALHAHRQRASGRAEEKGTGLGLFMFLAFLEQYGIGVPVGGSGTLTRALAKLIEDNGGQVVTGVDCDRIIVKAGRATGVMPRTAANSWRRTASSARSIRTISALSSQASIRPMAKDAAKTEIGANCVFTIHAALNEPLKFKAGDHVGKAMMIELLPPSLDHAARAFRRSALRPLAARASRRPRLAVESRSSRAPPGKATMHAWDYLPLRTSARRPRRLGRRRKRNSPTAHARPYERIYLEPDAGQHPGASRRHARSTWSAPRRASAEAISTASRPTPIQSGAHRPTPELGNYTVPGVERLYLVGPFQHPGGGVFGAGRATAIKMFDEMRLNFDKITAK